MERDERNVRGKHKGVKYQVIVPISPPEDLCERISKIHASAILQARRNRNDAKTE